MNARRPTPKLPAGWVRYELNLPRDLYDKAGQLAQAEGVSTAEGLRRLIARAPEPECIRETLMDEVSCGTSGED